MAGRPSGYGGRAGAPPPDPPDRTRAVPARDGTTLVLDQWSPRAEGAGRPAAGGARFPAGLPGVLLVHGLSSNARLWDGVADRLRRLGHEVAAVDLRGHGRSAKPDTGYDPATVVDDLVAVLDALASGWPGRASDRPGLASGRPGRPWGRPVVVGQSWGGNVVVELGWRHPERVRGVVAVDGGAIELADRFASVDAAWEVLAPPALSGTPATEVRATLRRHHPDWSEAAIDATMANLQVRGDGTVAPWLDRDHHRQVVAGLWAQRPSERWASMAVPVRFVMADDGSGGRARADKRRAVEAAVAALPDGEQHWVVPADHDVHAQHPGTVADLVHRWAVGWADAAAPRPPATGAPPAPPTG